MMSLEEYARHDGLALAELVRRGEVSAAELVECALAAIDRLNPRLNAVVRTLEDDARRIAEGPLPDAPLAGVPFLIKDLTVSYAGVPTECGSRFFTGWTRDYDSEILKRWKAGGLIVVGKTNTPELGASGSTEPVAAGATHNPWNLDHTPGGSSGGSAAAVAAGIVPAAHANDAGGSIRGPASCCGLVGLKPTRGRNPLGPDMGEACNGLVVEHVVSRSVRDTAAILDLTAGPGAPPDVGAPYLAPAPARPFLTEVTTPPGRLRIGAAVAGTKHFAFSAEAQEAVRRTAAALADLSHIVEEAEPDYDAELNGEVFMAVFEAAIAYALDSRAAMTGEAPTSETVEKNNLWLAERGRRQSAVDMLRTIDAMNRVTRQFARFFQTHDVWLTPTMATEPPRLGHLYADVDDVEEFFRRLWAFNPLNSVYNVTGQPAISLPLHTSPAGLPMGVMLGAGTGREDLLLRLAGQLEQAVPWRERWPGVGA
jgi:amidase